MESPNQTEQSLRKELRSNLTLALVVGLLIVGGLATWSYFAQISSAVVASGAITVEGNSKLVQHREGGLVKEILVSEGAIVDAGDILISLDDTVTRANLSIITKQLAELKAEEARLIAERDNLEDIAFPKVQDAAFDKRDQADIEGNQARLLASRRKSLEGRQNQLKEQIKQLKSQISGLIVQRDAKANEIELIDADIAANEILRQKDLVTQSKLNTLKRERAELTGEYGGFVAEIAQLGQAVSEKEFESLQLAENSLTEILEQYHDVRSKVAQLQEEEVSARDKLKHIFIRSPQKGVVHQLSVHTVGAVIPPGETLMMIVPRGDRLIVEAQVNPNEIDRLSTNQQARLKFPAFDSRTTPEISANLDVISADRITDQANGQSYYLVKMSFKDEELSKLGDKHLVPGMPVEVYLQTGYRSVLSYLVKPVMDQIEHALKEK